MPEPPGHIRFFESLCQILSLDFAEPFLDASVVNFNENSRFQDEETNRFYLDNGKEKLILPAMTFKSIVSPESLHPQPEAFKDAEIAEESPAAVLGKTTLLEFSMIRLTTLQKLTVVIPKLYALLYIVSNNFSWNIIKLVKKDSFL